MSQENQHTEGQGIAWVDADEDHVVRLVLTGGEEKINVGSAKGPGEYALVRTAEGDSPTDHECPECARTFRVRWTGPTAAHHAKTRYCPRCGARL